MESMMAEHLFAWILIGLHVPAIVFCVFVFWSWSRDDVGIKMDAPVGKRITKLANKMADLSRRHGRLANRKAKRERKRDRLEDKVAALGRKQNDLVDNLAGLAGRMVDSLEELKTPAETDLPPFAAQPPPPVADAETSYGSYTPPHPPPVSSARVFTAHSQEREKNI